MTEGGSKILRGVVVSSAVASVWLPVSAQMIGDTITIRRLYPDIHTEVLPPVAVLVAAGPSDLVSAFHDSNFDNTFDPEASSITIRWTGSSAYIGTPLLVDGFGFSGFSRPIDSVSTSGVDGISVVDLGFTATAIWVNVNGRFNGSAAVDLDIVFQPVPEPAAQGLLLGGLAGLGAWARRRSPANV